MFLPASATFLSVAAITVDRLLAVPFHLRYQELVTYRKTLVYLWLTYTYIFIRLPSFTLQQ